MRDPITSVRVSKYTDAGYAFELEITDSSGTVSTFTKCDNIRTILSKYAKSSRLTIGKSTEITVNEGETITIDPYNIVQTDKDGKPVISTTAVGSTTLKSVISGTGEVKELPVTESSTYVISGTGWGHGVGLSQYGARDMANNGYLWHEIATYFFPGAYLANLHNLSVDIMTEPEAPIVPEEPEEPVSPVTPTEPDDEEEADEDEEPTEEDDEIVVIPGGSAFDGPIKVI